VVLGIGAYAWWASFERRLSESEALQIAAAVVAEEKIDLSMYYPPKVTSQPVGSGWVWSVDYQGKPTRLGHFFVITIDDATGKAELSGGA